MNPRSASQVSSLMLRLAVGLTMLCIGISAYRDLPPFLANLTDSLGFLSGIAYVIGFILPALLIFGGGLLAVGRYPWVAAWTGGLAIAVLPIGTVLKTVVSNTPLPDTIAAAYPSLVWLIAFYLAVNQFPEMEPEAPAA